MSLLLLHGTHRKIESMNLALFNLQKKTNQHLIDFYSIDKWVIYEDIPEKVTGRKQRKRVKATASGTNITQADQEKLWEFPHHATQHFPGKLSSCIGMPVMFSATAVQFRTLVQ